MHKYPLIPFFFHIIDCSHSAREILLRDIYTVLRLQLHLLQRDLKSHEKRDSEFDSDLPLFYNARRAQLATVWVLTQGKPPSGNQEFSKLC